MKTQITSIRNPSLILILIGAVTLLLYILATARPVQARLALVDYLRSFKLAQANPEDYNNAALLQYELGMHSNAVESLNTAIRLKPEEGIFYFNRALNHNILGDTDRVGEDLKKAAELGVQRAREILTKQDSENEK